MEVSKILTSLISFANASTLSSTSLGCRRGHRPARCSPSVMLPYVIVSQSFFLKWRCLRNRAAFIWLDFVAIDDIVWNLEEAFDDVQPLVTNTFYNL